MSDLRPMKIFAEIKELKRKEEIFCTISIWMI